VWKINGGYPEGGLIQALDNIVLAWPAIFRPRKSSGALRLRQADNQRFLISIFGNHGLG